MKPRAEDLLTYGEAATIAGCPFDGIRRAVQYGKLKAVEVPGIRNKRVRRADLAAFLAKQAEDNQTVHDIAPLAIATFKSSTINPSRGEHQ